MKHNTLQISLIRSIHTHRNLIDKTTKKSNEINQVGLLNFLEPSLLLVPKMNTDPSANNDLLACDQLKVKTLHFSHYSFLNGLFQMKLKIK